MARQYGAPPEDPREPKGNRYAERGQKEPQTKPADPSPTSDVVVKFHKNAPVDTRAEDVHHTIGPTNTQAAAGDHNHDGGNSVLLLEGITLVGSKANPATVIPSILAALSRLGAKDTTT